MTGPFILGQLVPNNPTSKVPSFLLSDIVLIVLAALVLGGICVAWLVWVRGPKSDISPARRVYKGISPPAPSGDQEEESSGSSGRRRKKKRSRRREHRSRNPTLSETGGLPPPKGPEAPLIP